MNFNKIITLIFNELLFLYFVLESCINLKYLSYNPDKIYLIQIYNNLYNNTQIFIEKLIKIFDYKVL